MLKYLIFFLLATVSISQVVSRNNRLSQMQKKMKLSISQIDNLLAVSEQQMNSDLNSCIESAKNQNCSNLNVWEHQRKKHSKNITNMQIKIGNHQETIEKIISVNQKETQKKQLTINALLPKIQNLKDTIEYIENIEWLIKDTYVNIEDSKSSLMHLFDVKSHQQIQSIMAQLMRKQQVFHDPGAKPQQKEYLPEHPEEPPKPEVKFNQGPPLIDEEIFDGHNEQYEEEPVPQIFDGSKSDEKLLKPDVIPDGIDIPEHDDQAKEIDEILKKYIEKQELDKESEKEDTDLDIQFGEKAFKENVKRIGQKLYEKLSKFRVQVQEEEDSLVQGVADLEKAIFNLHHRHANQIVQIYIETKKLQREIFEKDDIVLALDSKIHDCQDMEKILKECEQNKILDQEYLENLRAQKAINEGIIKEISKLMLYEDKNVELPNIKPEEIKVEAEKVANEIQSEKEQELNKIKEAEKEVEAEEENIESIVPIEEEIAQPEVEIPEVEEEAPIQQQVPEETPLEETPIEETPIEQTPAEETPIEETPAAATEETLLLKLMKNQKNKNLKNELPKRKKRSRGILGKQSKNQLPGRKKRSRGIQGEQFLMKNRLPKRTRRQRGILGEQAKNQLPKRRRRHIF